MPSYELDHLLRQSVDEVLETMFFIREFDPAGQSPDESQVMALMDFEGSPSGSLRVSVNGKAARSIAADFLGEEEQTISQQQIEEVICELTNMICGSVLSKVEATALFHLSTPEIVRQPQNPEKPLETAIRSTARVAQSAITVAMYSEASRCSTAVEYAF